ncbi:MAG TPA: CPBP family intramembrane glutamic endopeptidase [Candidatus Sulfotelmatobacter sp.]|nr:CPBP family intramembrane glutamic endopeptidase [Candidatus Sulfotelmatobacter sp.]
MPDPETPQTENPIAASPSAFETRKPYTIFRGPTGIRAGWRVLLFFFFMAAAIFLVAIPFALFHLLRGHGNQVSVGIGPSGITPLGLALSEGILFVFPSIAALVMARIEHRRYGDYGLPLRSAFAKNFWIGTLAGFVSISGCLLGIFALHGFHLSGMGIHGSTIVSATAAWGATFVLVGLAEEFSFRGYLQYTLTSGIGFWPAAVVMSIAFGLAHSGNPGESKFGLFSVVLFGLLFCLFLRRTGNLWWAVGFHAGWDWGQTFFYGVPDSGIPAYHNLFNSSFSGPRWLTGGTVGPEASVFTPVVLAIVAILFARVYSENKYLSSTSTPRPLDTAAQSPTL